MSSSSSISSGFLGYPQFSEPSSVTSPPCNWASCPVLQETLDKKALHIYLKVIEFFAITFGHVGVDGNGRIPPIIRVSTWSPVCWISRADGENGRSLAGEIHLNEEHITPEAIAHEYTHGVIHSTFVKLNRAGEPGALNESISDIFGVAFKHWFYNQNDDWSVSNRNMMLEVHKGKVELSLDFFNAAFLMCGNDPTSFDIHYRCIIPSRAFYLAVSYSKTCSWGAVAQIWFKTLSYLTPDESFLSFATKTICIAETFFPSFTESITLAWLSVGILKYSSPVDIQMPIAMADDI